MEGYEDKTYIQAVKTEFTTVEEVDADKIIVETLDGELFEIRKVETELVGAVGGVQIKIKNPKLI